jgi:2-polyprenyl-3-methyl-5-hydroxy-6-metoxy-1,4-benzoquinol methylase
VDRVIDAATLAESLVPDWFDIVISTEMLEHAQDWRACVAAMVNVLAPAGLWVVTTRSPGFPYHGYPDDHWRYTIDTATGIIDAAGLDMLILESDPQAPGVFWKARKPETWTGCGDLEQIQLEKAPS